MWTRVSAIFFKEFIQLARERLTLLMVIAIPVFQLILFGFAINTDPKQMPTALVMNDNSPLVRNIVRTAENTGYFKFMGASSDEHAEQLLQLGQAQFVFEFPAGFSRKLLRGERPSVLVYADASDPTASEKAIAALLQLPTRSLKEDLRGPLAQLSTERLPFDILVHKRYNPEGITSYNVVPGLLGVILTMTLILMTAMAITRERERGTFENLIAMPFAPFEVMLGKILPYILIGYLQVLMVYAASRLCFHVPMLGSFTLLSATVLLFMIALLSVGFTFSAIATSQVQAMQMTLLFFLPSILLSGFMFPFRGMPVWAQVIGELLPLTHFLRITRGIMLKGSSLVEVLPHVWPIATFIFVTGTFGLIKYRRTLD